MPSEDPILDVPFVLSYDQSDVSFPIIAVPQDPRSRTIPAIFDPLKNPEWHTDFPNNLFEKSQIIPGSTKRVLWIYRILPGPLISGQDIDKVTGIVFPYTKQIVASGTVSAGVTGAGVITLRIANAGTGFTGNPTLTIAAPGGGGVTATATATYSAGSGAVTALTLTNPGLGYTSLPAVTIFGGGTATATATLRPTSVLSLTFLSSGSGFIDVPPVLFTGGGGAGATGIATLAPTTIATATVDAPGSGYTMATATLVGAGGSGAMFTVTLGGGGGDEVVSISVDAAGTGYTSRGTLVISGDGTGAMAHVVLTGTSVTEVTLTGTGSGYTDVPTVTITDGSGTAYAAAGLAPTTLGTLVLVSSTGGFTTATVAITAGGGSGATATATVGTGFINTVTLTLAGSGYLANPIVTVSGGGGTGAVVLATIGSLTFVEVEPQDARTDLVMRTTVLLSSLPAAKVYPIDYRVQRSSITNASLLTLQTSDGVAWGLVEFAINGGSGPVLAYVRELYMTDQQLETYDPGTFSNTGFSESYTLLGAATVDNVPHIQTFRVTPGQQGTSIGVISLDNQRLKYGLRLVKVVFLTQSY